jgi:AAA15 family ATPase/GTPase
VIDEPEMNAHPQAQLRTVELLARLVNSGVSVVVTTHSPYFIDHLNNLIEGSRANERARSLLAPKFKPGARSPWLSPDNVSVYLFSEKGEVSDVFDRTNAQIDVTTFSEASDYVGNLYARLLEAQPKK